MTRARGNFPARFYHFLLPVACALVCLIGCHKKSASRAEIRSVTGGNRRRGPAAPQDTNSKSKSIRKSRPCKRAPDTEIRITSPIVSTSGLENPAQANTLERSLGEIARRHKLTVDESSSAKMLRVDFSRAGIRTHSIHLIVPLTGRLHPAAGAPSGGATGPRLAIIIDDMGGDRAPADELLALPIPLTISILPHLPLSRRSR